jgi:light-regulated signal transduction histidine kinase (bacteriophytochrome)
MFQGENNMTFRGKYSCFAIREEGLPPDTKGILIQDISHHQQTDELTSCKRLMNKMVKDQDQFTYIVTHDLRASLRAITNLTTWIQEDLESILTEESRQNMNMLKGRVARMDSMISALADFAKIVKPQQSPEPVDTYQMLTGMVQLLTIPSHIQLNMEAAMPVLLTSKSELFQIFYRLIDNAIRFNDKAKGYVNVYSSEREDHWVFTVEDNGPGIPAEYHERIFTVFQTLQSRDKFESNGMGLAIVKRILENNDADIQLFSEPGEGSKFVFTWPKKLKYNYSPPKSYYD